MGTMEYFELCETSFKKYNALVELCNGKRALSTAHAASARSLQGPTVEQGKIRRPVNSWLRYSKESHPWRQTWTICAADLVPPQHMIC